MAGALLAAEWQSVLNDAGFSEVLWGREVDVFSGSRHESDAKEFETYGITFSARRL